MACVNQADDSNKLCLTDTIRRYLILHSLQFCKQRGGQRRLESCRIELDEHTLIPSVRMHRAASLTSLCTRVVRRRARDLHFPQDSTVRLVLDAQPRRSRRSLTLHGTVFVCRGALMGDVRAPGEVTGAYFARGGRYSGLRARNLASLPVS